MPKTSSDPIRTAPGRRKANPKQLQRLHDLGNTQAEIAKITGLSHTGVANCLKELLPDREAVRRFRTDRAEVFSSLSAKSLILQQRIIESFDGDGDYGIA